MSQQIDCFVDALRRAAPQAQQRDTRSIFIPKWRGVRNIDDPERELDAVSKYNSANAGFFSLSPLIPHAAFAALIKQTQKLLPKRARGIIVGLNLNEAQLSLCITDVRVQKKIKKMPRG